MHGPPSNPQDRPAWNEPTWNGIVVGYAMMALIPLLLWVVSQPLVATLTLALIVGGSVGVRRAMGLSRCLAECRQFTVALGRNHQITISQRCVCETN